MLLCVWCGCGGVDVGGWCMYEGWCIWCGGCVVVVGVDCVVGE